MYTFLIMLCFYPIGKNKKKNNYANILMKQEKKVACVNIHHVSTNSVDTS